MSFNVYPEQTNHLDLFYFRVVITNFGAAATEGFIDHLTPSWYGTNNPPFDFPATRADSETKERANMRYERMLVELSQIIAPVKILNIDNGGADQDNQGATFAFTVGFDREEYLYAHNELFGTAHATGTDEIIYDPLLAIQRWVVRTFINPLVQTRELFDPTTTGVDPDDPVKIEEITADRLVAAGTPLVMITAAEAFVAVTAITDVNP